MLFNSLQFIFVFLPFAVLLHYTLARWSIDAAICGTAITSLAFYAWWNPPLVILPITSIVANFWLARWIVASRPAASRHLLIAGIAANLLVLCYFKYADFLVSIVEGTKAAPDSVPLGLSFTTFVQIAFLSDVYHRRIPLRFSLYGLFVAFFPHLIAGPIVRWTSLGNQLDEPERYRVNWDNIALGLTIFTCGLVKKVLIADSLSRYVNTAFDAAGAQEPFTMFGAWGAAFGFTAQLYFDFSGYSDMAIGLGLLFNYRLPINFAAPLRATNLFDFWRRWHITLSRFLREFVFVPLHSGQPGPVRASFSLLATMLLGGLWHGAGWTYIIWGGIHGCLLIFVRLWGRVHRPVLPKQIGQFLGWALTITAFTIAIVFFRADSVDTAWHLIQAMAGFGDAVMPGHATFDNWIVGEGYVSDAFASAWFGSTWSIAGTLAVGAALAIALLFPDTMEIVGYTEGEASSDWRRPVGIFAWSPTAAWLCLVAATAVIAVINMGGVSEFLYYQF